MTPNEIVRSLAANLQARWFLWRQKPLFTRFLESSPVLLVAYLAGHVAAFLFRSYVVGSHAWF